MKTINILIILIVFQILIHVPYLMHPALDTETSYFYTAVSIADNHFNPFTPSFEEKPPLTFMIPSVLMKFFPSMIWGRLESLIASVFVLIYIYKTGEFLYSPVVGLFSVILCIFFPLFAVQSVFFTDVMPQAALFAATLYYFFTNNRKGYIVSASLGVLTKETMVFLPIIFYLYSGIERALNNKQKMFMGFMRSAFLLIPCVVFAFWMAANKYYFGYYFYPGNSINMLNGFANYSMLLSDVRKFSLKFIQSSDGLILYLLGSVLYLDFFIRRASEKNTDKKFTVLLIVLVIFYRYFFRLPSG